MLSFLLLLVKVVTAAVVVVIVVAIPGAAAVIVVVVAGAVCHQLHQSGDADGLVVMEAVAFTMVTMMREVELVVAGRLQAADLKQA